MSGEMRTEYLDPEQLRRQVNAARRVSFFIRTSTTLITKFDDEGKPERGFDGMGGPVSVTQAEAMKWLADLSRFCSIREERGESRPVVAVTKSEPPAACWFLG